MNYTDHARMMGRLDACLEAEPHRMFDDHEQQAAYRDGFRYMAARLESRAVVRQEFADEFPYADSPGGWGTAVNDGVREIESHLGECRSSAANPCGAAVYYDAGIDKPWRISDDQWSETFATLADAVEGAKAWRVAMCGE